MGWIKTRLAANSPSLKHPFPCPTSYRTALTYYLDITNPPRTNVLYELAQYASEPAEQEQLRKMASSSGEGKVGLPPAPQHPERQPPRPGHSPSCLGPWAARRLTHVCVPRSCT